MDLTGVIVKIKNFIIASIIFTASPEWGVGGGAEEEGFIFNKLRGGIRTNSKI
jgi:hypothetical protein